MWNLEEVSHPKKCYVDRRKEYDKHFLKVFTTAKHWQVATSCLHRAGAGCPGCYLKHQTTAA